MHLLNRRFRFNVTGMGWMAHRVRAGSVRCLQNIFTGLSLLAIADPALAQGDQDLKRLSLEELPNTEVPSVSGISAPRPRPPAAVYVITGDDIRRSGAA